MREHTRSVFVRFDELNGLASPVEAIVPIFLVTQIVSNDSGDQLVEVGAPVLADLQTACHGARQENCRDQNTPTAASDFHRQTSKFHSRAREIFGGEKSQFQFGDYMSVFFPE